MKIHEKNQVAREHSDMVMKILSKEKQLTLAPIWFPH